MAKRISTLSVALGATVSPFNNAFKGAGNVLTGFTAKAGAAASAVTRLTGIGAAIATIAGGVGMGALLHSQSEAIDNTAKLSDRLGITTEAFEGIDHAAGLAGVGTEQLTGGFEFMLKNTAKAAEGGNDLAESFKGIGLDASKLIKLDPSQEFNLIANALASIENPAKRALASTQIFGKSGQQLLPLLMAGASGIKAARLEAEQLGLTFSRVDAAKVEEANDAVTKLQGAAKGVARQFVVAMAPAILQAAEVGIDFGKRVVSAVKTYLPIAIEYVGKQWARIKTFVSPIADYIESSIASIVGFVRGNASQFAGALVGIGAVIFGPSVIGAILAIVPTVAGVAAAILSPVGLIIGAFAAIGAAIGWDNIQAGFTALVAWVTTNSAQIYAIVSSTWASISAVVTSITTSIWGVVTSAWTAIYNVVSSVVTSIGAVIATNWQSYLQTAIGFGVAIYTAVSSVVAGVVDLVSYLWNGISSLWSAGTQYVTGETVTFGQATGGVFETLASVVSWFTDGLSATLTIAGFAIKNWRLTFETAGLGVAFAVVRLGNQIAWVFTDVIPAVFTWAVENFKDFAKLSSTILQNLASNTISVFTNLPGLIAGSTSWEEVWTPLTDGFEAAAKSLSIPDRVAGDLETSLGDAAAAAGDKWRDGLFEAMNAQDRQSKGMTKNITDAFGKLKVPAPDFKPVTSGADTAAKQTAAAFGDALKPPTIPKLDTSDFDTSVDAVKGKAAELKAIFTGSADSQKLRYEAMFAAGKTPAQQTSMKSAAAAALPKFDFAPEVDRFAGAFASPEVDTGTLDKFFGVPPLAETSATATQLTAAAATMPVGAEPVALPPTITTSHSASGNDEAALLKQLVTLLTSGNRDRSDILRALQGAEKSQDLVASL
jgi:phage-related protein